MFTDLAPHLEEIVKVTCNLPRKETLASPLPGGGTPYAYDGLYGEAPPERGVFLRLQVYERVGISHFSFGSVKGPKRANTGMNFMAL